MSAHLAPRLHTPAGMCRLKLQLLGGFRALDSADRELKIASRKGRALLAYLAVRADESHSRDRLAALLWEDADQELGRTSLRQALAGLRKSLPNLDQALETSTDAVVLRSTAVDCDLHALRRALANPTRASLQTAAAVYKGDLLDGLEAKSTAFDEWLSNERLSLRKQTSSVLQKLMQLCLSSDDTDGALAACHQLVALEPLNEAAHRSLMELYARSGNPTAALRQYRLCRDALRRELDVAPEPATEQLYRELMKRRRSVSDREAPNEDELEPASSEPAVARTRDLRPQLRDAVILVARLEGLLDLEASLDPEDAHAIGAEFHRMVQCTVEAHGGCTDRRVGSTVLAAFGVPNAYGNESERCARAALALRRITGASQWAKQHHLRLRIGMAQGQVLCEGEVFPLTGKAAHLAHSLAARADDDTVLLAEELRAALGARATCEPVAVSEWAQPAWRLRELVDALEAEQPLVGRRPELAMILAALERSTSSRHGRAIVIRGEAGIGKTRIVDALRSAARERSIAVHTAQILDFGQAAGHGPITTLALSMVGLNAQSCSESRCAKVNELAREHAVNLDLQIFLSDLIEAPLTAELEELERAMDADARRRGRALAVSYLIERAAQNGPQLLIIEDVHWADNDELTRLCEIAASIANCPVLMVLTTRPEGDPITAAWRARARGCPLTTVDLAPLAEDEARELAQRYPQLDAHTVQQCIERAEGYPLFLEQLLRAAASGQTSLPGSVRALVVARADGLADLEHRALHAAAVLGQRFDRAPVASMLGAETYDADALIASGLVRECESDLQFAHALFRDAIYESMLKSERRDWHRRAAQWFASRDVVLYADHLAAAEDERAAAAYLEAARAEQSALRYERALTLASKALALAREPVLLHAVSCLSGELLLQLGRTHDALTAYREALDFAVEPMQRGQAWFGVASALRIMDRHEEALDALDRAETQLAHDADAVQRARLYTLRGNLCFPLGRLDACLAAHERAYALAQEAGSHVEVARALGGLGDAYYQRGQMLTARTHFERCVTQARQHNLPGILLGNLFMLAVTEIFSGNLRSGMQTLSEGLALATRAGDPRSELLMHLCTSFGLLMQARFEEAKRTVQRACQIAARLGARRFQSEGRGLHAVALLGEGAREDALRLAREAVQLGRETGLSYCGPISLGIVARATFDADERRAALAEAESLLAKGCVSHSYLDFYAHAMEVSLETGAWDEARRYASALEAYTSREPLLPSTLAIRRARLLAEVGEGRVTSRTREELQAVRTRCQEIEFNVAVPAIDRALRSL